MPIWPVSLVDGIYQVADADGALYPITMRGDTITQFNPGWSPRGLQTGLAPLHVLELDHAEGEQTFWMLDPALDYRGNAVVHLNAADRAAFFAHMEPLVRTLFGECVCAPHSAIPAGAHAFAGFATHSVRTLLEEAAIRAIGTPDLVMLDALDGLGGFARDGISLQPAWINQAMANLAVPQETLDLPGHTAFRHLDPASGLVHYLIEGPTPDQRLLYVPAAGVAFARGPVGLPPLLSLLTWYATHTDRAVLLPEMEDLGPGLVHALPAAQHGLDEPAADHEAPVAPVPVADAALLPDPAEVEAEVMVGTPPVPGTEHRPSVDRLPPVEMSRPAAPREATPVHPLPALPKQNWWQRLLGLGHGE